MSDLRKAAEMSIEAIMDGDVKDKAAAVYALRQALAQPEQEPVAYLDEGLGAFYWPNDYALLPHKDFTPLYTAPPKREHEWVGLTDEEVDECYYWKDRLWTTDELVRHVEAKLKEKNA